VLHRKLRVRLGSDRRPHFVFGRSGNETLTGSFSAVEVPNRPAVVAAPEEELEEDFALDEADAKRA